MRDQGLVAVRVSLNDMLSSYYQADYATPKLPDTKYEAKLICSTCTSPTSKDARTKVFRLPFPLLYEYSYVEPSADCTTLNTPDCMIQFRIELCKLPNPRSTLTEIAMCLVCDGIVYEPRTNLDRKLSELTALGFLIGK